MNGSNRYVRSGAKDMPAAFYLPPQSNAPLWQETWKLVLGCVAFIVVLGIIVALTHGIVVQL
jgi:hypothetical protein